MNSYLFAADKIEIKNSPKLGLLPSNFGFSSPAASKCTSSVSVSNVTVSTSINSKTKVIENQTITLKRQASSSLGLFSPKKNHIESGFKSSVELEYGLAPLSSKPKFLFGSGQPRSRKKKHYVINNGFGKERDTVSMKSMASDNDSFVFGSCNVSPVKTNHVDENGQFVHHFGSAANSAQIGSSRLENTANSLQNVNNNIPLFKVPNVATFEFSFSKKIPPLKKNLSLTSNETNKDGDILISDAREDEYFHFKPFEEFEPPEITPITNNSTTNLNCNPTTLTKTASSDILANSEEMANSTVSGITIISENEKENKDLSGSEGDNYEVDEKEDEGDKTMTIDM